MGAKCSGGESAGKKKAPKQQLEKGADINPANLLLDEDGSCFKTLAIEELDTVFSNAESLMEDVIESNNGLISVREGILSAAGFLFDGSINWVCTIVNDSPVVELFEWCPNDKVPVRIATINGKGDVEIERKPRWDAMEPATLTAIDETNKSLGILIQMREATKKNVGLRVFNGRIVFNKEQLIQAKATLTGDEVVNVPDHLASLADFNQNLASAKWLAMKEVVKDGAFDLVKAIKKLMVMLVQTLGEVLWDLLEQVSVTLTLEKLLEGELELNCNLTEVLGPLLDKLKAEGKSVDKRVEACINALFQDDDDGKGIFPYLIELANDLFGLKEKATALAESSKAVIDEYQSVSVLKEKCSDKGLQELMALPKKIMANGKKLKAIPASCQTVGETLKFVALELKDAVMEGKVNSPMAAEPVKEVKGEAPKAVVKKA